ncbi:MAG: hypothetical protein M1825_005427 [Sarcosagium campestre]|nr:MAG: hypothetical protein M1825_005427 [Sarcosagium campestre]
MTPSIPNSVLSYVGWTFLPNMVTGWVQTLYYGVMIRAGDPKPLPGSARYTRDRRRINMAVIVIYLLYSIYEADWELRRAGHFYQDLGVAPDVDEKGIKSRFRRLAAQFHPDKIASSVPREEIESRFIHLRLAQDVLLEPTKRLAYDRFGPSIIEWPHCSSFRDYLVHGAQELGAYYLLGGLVMVVLGVLGYFEWGRYWRYLAFAALGVFETHTLTRPYFPPVATKFVNPILSKLTDHPPLLPFQILILARKTVVALFVALSQLGPLFQQPDQAKKKPTSAEEAQRQQLDRLDTITRSADFEATRLLGLDLAPFINDELAMKDVRSRLKEWLVQNTIRSEPEVRDAMGRVMSRRRTGVPASARGNR